MPKQIRKLWKQVASSKHVFGAITIFVLLLMVSFASMLIIIVPPASAAYTDFGYRKLITIDHTKVGETLTNFPVWVYNVSNDFKDSSNGGVILPNGSDIAFYSFDNSTKYNHEIEIYNGTNGTIGIWVNVTSVSSTVDTTFWMYYGYANSLNQQNIFGTWNANYTAVWHMNDNISGGLVNDSTSGRHNGTILGGMSTSGGVRRGPGGATSLPFDGIDDVIVVPDDDALSFNDSVGNTDMPFSVECIYYKNNTKNNAMIAKMNKSVSAGCEEYQVKMGEDTSYPSLNCFRSWNDTAYGVSYDVNISSGFWQYGCWEYVGNSSTYGMYIKINTTNVTISRSPLYTPARMWNTIANLTIGGMWYPVVYWYNFSGSMDELRLSNILRTQAWTDATYNTIFSPSTFLTFGTQVTAGAEASSYSLKFNMGTRIDWAGTSGTTVWSNSSGTYTETMEINLTVNSSDNVTDIRVWVGNMNDSGLWVNASNITLLVSSDNSSYGSLGAFTDGGINISINASTWVPGTMGTSPFTYSGITNTNRSIFCRFKLAIPSAATTNYYFNNTNWRVYIGRYV